MNNIVPYWFKQNIKRLFLISLLILIIFIIYDFSSAVTIPDIKVPGELTKDYAEIGRDFAIPWAYLAAIDEVKNNYQNVDSSKIQTTAKMLNKIIIVLGGTSKENVKKAIDQLYSKDTASKIIDIAESYQWAAAPLDKDYLFPFPDSVRDKISYDDTWGAGRSFGGDRRHEGTDLMAEKGTPLIAVTEGLIIKKGWNRLGGWTVTLLDLRYPHIAYYYAHLSKYPEGLYVGKKFKKGDIIGYVGDSGYGPEGTTGMFPSHLHFGIYVRENWLAAESTAVNPYPFLRAWYYVN